MSDTEPPSKKRRLAATKSKPNYKDDDEEEWMPSEQDEQSKSDSDSPYEENGSENESSQDIDIANNDQIKNKNNDKNDKNDKNEQKSIINSKSNSNDNNESETNNNDETNDCDINDKIDNDGGNDDNNNNNNNDSDGKSCDDNDDSNDNSDDYSDNEDEIDKENNDNNKKKKELTKEQKECLNLIKLTMNLSAAQYKEILSFMKNLRDNQRQKPFENCIKITGKKDDLKERYKDHLFHIFSKSAPNSNSNNRWARWFRVRASDNQWKEWQLSLIKYINNVIKNGNETKQRRKSSVLRKQYQPIKDIKNRLKLLEKQQLIDIMAQLIEDDYNDQNDCNNSNNNEESSNNGVLFDKIVSLLPMPNLDKIYDNHTKLINAIGKARPYTRYGSSSDHFCYKRCKSAIAHARNAIINDTNQLAQTKQWETIVQFLKITVNTCDDFPSWDNAGDNTDEPKVRNALFKIYQRCLKDTGLLSNESKSKSKTKTKKKDSNNNRISETMKDDLDILKQYFEKHGMKA